MRTLLIGGSGRVGTGTAPFLVGLGHEVSVYDVRPPQVEGVRYIEGSIFDNAALKAAMEEHDGIIQMVLHQTWESFQDGLEVNVRGLRESLVALLETKHRHMVYTSTTSLHNERDVKFYHDESLPAEAMHDYGYQKAMAEELLRYFCRIHTDLSIIALRLHGPISYDQWREYRKGGHLGATTHSDVARSFDAALRQKSHKGFDAVFISGDPTGTYINTTKAKNLLGWEALDRYPDEPKPAGK